MTKKYAQPAVVVTEMEMIHTLCVSEGGGGGSTFSALDPSAITDEQL